MTIRSEPPEDQVFLYRGRWVARVGPDVIGQGGTPQQALQAAKASRFKEFPHIEYVPTSEPLTFSNSLSLVRNVLPSGVTAYLVGGAVRDALRGQPVNDLDFVLPADALSVARIVGDNLDSPYFPLDEKRETGRVILDLPDSQRVFLDFTVFQGPDLESDLRTRDFTINAMAVDVFDPEKLLDPLGGAADLRSKLLRACSGDTFILDPLRILRAIRFAAELNYHIEPITRKLMRESIKGIASVSHERMRDEIFRILAGPRPATSIQAIEILGALPYTFPELLDLKGLPQSPPHITDVWNHTLDTLQKLEAVLEVLSVNPDPDSSTNLHHGLLSLRLGRFRSQFDNNLNAKLNPDRSLRPLLFMAALYHDAGKSITRSVDEKGRTRFFGHEQAGANMVVRRAQELRLSNQEIGRLQAIVKNHMRPILLAQTGDKLTRRAVYRYFRDCGIAGVDICLLTLADVFATYGHTLPLEIWSRQVEVVRTLLEAYWEHYPIHIAPKPLINGDDLIHELGVKPGPIVGVLLEGIRESQACGEVHDRESALQIAKQLLEQQRNG